MTNNRLSQISKKMAMATFCLIIIMLFLNAASWLFPILNSVEGGYGISFSLTDNLISSLDIDLSIFPWWQILGGIILSSIPLFFLAYGLYQLSQLFQGYSRGEYFSVSSAIRLGKVGKSIAMWVLLDFICEPLLSFWVTMRLPERVIGLSLSSSTIIALFLAASITVIAYILKQASQLEEENKQFI